MTVSASGRSWVTQVMYTSDCAWRPAGGRQDAPDDDLLQLLEADAQQLGPGVPVGVVLDPLQQGALSLVAQPLRLDVSRHPDEAGNGPLPVGALGEIDLHVGVSPSTFLP